MFVFRKLLCIFVFYKLFFLAFGQQSYHSQSSNRINDYRHTLPTASTPAATTVPSNLGNSSVPTKFQFVVVNFPYVQGPFMVSSWVLLSSVVRLVVVNNNLSTFIPASSCMIIAGLIVGVLLDVFGHEPIYLTAQVFFLFLLPPINFGSSYDLPLRLLFDNFDSVMLFAFFGTTVNALSISGVIVFCSWLNIFSMPIPVLDALVFGSVISAIDPIAVIAIFAQIGVNDVLFINIFGEALFNDGVCLAMYNTYLKFATIGSENLHYPDYLQGAASITVVLFGGISIGIVAGLMASFLTKYTAKVRILAPVFVFIFPYMAYLTAQTFNFSATMAAVAAGITIKEYVTGSLTYGTASTVKYAVNVLQEGCETVLFMFLGISTVDLWGNVDWVFVCVVTFSCFMIRTIAVLVQCTFLNFFRHKKIPMEDQFILSYGGLRGAVSYGMAMSLPDTLKTKQIFLSTTIFMIFFTMFLQGSTIKKLLKWLQVETISDDKNNGKTFQFITNRVIDFSSSGAESIVGHHGRHFIRGKFEKFNARFLKPIFTRNYRSQPYDNSRIMRAFNKAVISDVMQHVDNRDAKVPRLNFTETFQRQQTEDFPSRPVSAAPTRWVSFVDELGTPIQQLERSPPPGRSTFIY